MEPVLFFYSTDGTNTFGPVTEDALRRLLKDQIIGPASFVCAKGETEWKPLDIDALRRLPPQTSRLPRYEPPPYVPTIMAKEREEARVQGFAEVRDEGPWPAALKWGSGICAAVASIILAALQGGIQGVLAGFLVGLLFMGLIPYSISLAFKRAWRLRVWALAMGILSTLIFLGQAHYGGVLRAGASSPSTDDGILSEARQQIAQKGFFDGDASPAQTGPEKLKEETGDDTSEPGRMVHASLAVDQEVLDKIKASEAAEKECGSFDPASLASQLDLRNLREHIANLRGAQADVLSYFETYDDHCRAALANGNFSSTGIEQFVAGAHQAAHIDQAVAVWQVRVKLTDDHLARLDFLDKRWGSWQPKDGKLLFSSQSDLDAYNALTLDLVADIKRGQDLQNQALAK